MGTKFDPQREPIAIVGSACRFAGEATTPSDLWRLLRDPKDLTKEIPADRFNIKGFYHPEGEHNGTTDSPKAYFLQQSHKIFDAGFFNILPKEAEAIDPQQRLLLEVVYEALESAGYPLDKHSGQSVAVYAGIMTADYDTLSQRDDLNTSQYYATGNARSIVANRISYFFNFGGPSMTIDTACSSSLVALDQAVNSLRAGKCDMACVTGANLILTPEQFIAESSLHMLSPTGHCRMWDVNADGYARGEGVAAIFVKPLSKALADGDRIEALIRDIGVNSDGRTKGITMPSWRAQANLIKETYQRAGLDLTKETDRCQFFEAHGTGTKAGDPNEARAIQSAFFQPPASGLGEVDEGGDGSSSPLAIAHVPGTGKLLVGSIKTVVGHTEGAAGLAGLIKVVQSIQNSQVPPNLHLNKLAPAVAAVSPNLEVVTELQDWPQLPDGIPKRASVNSFGFGGTNSHIIVEEYLAEIHDKLIPEGTIKKLDEPVAGEIGRISLPLTLSGTSRDSLCDVLIEYRNHVFRNRRNSDWNVNDVAWHTYARRTALPFRAAVAGDGVPLIHKLNLLIDQLDVKGKDKESRPTDPELEEKVKLSGPGPLIARSKSDKEKPRILGVFTGQGAQWATMSKHLLETNNTYATTIRRLDEVLKALPDPPAWTLEDQIKAGSAISRVNQAEISQPLCTAVQLGILAIFKKLEIKLLAVVGHSSGEIAAAAAAGKLSPEGAIVIAYYRGKFAHLAKGERGEKGGMVVVGISEQEAKERFKRYGAGTYLTVAAINQTELVTVSGNKDAVETFTKDLVEERGVFNRPLKVDVAYHSPHMQLASDSYLKALARSNIVIETPNPGEEVAWVSSVNEFRLPDDDGLKGDYWVENMEKPVRFLPALEEVMTNHGPFDCVVEIGPRPSLKSAVTRVLVGKEGKPLPYCGVLETGFNDTVTFADFLGFLWLQFGCARNMIYEYLKDSSEPEMRYNRLRDPPIYPWDHRQSYIRESRVCRQYHFRADAPHELLGVRTRDDDEYLLRWRNVLKLDQIKWGTGHTFQGAHLVPGSGYCSMAYDAAKVFLGLSGRTASVIELVDLHFYSGITLAANTPGIETLFSLTIDESPKTFTRKAQSVVEGSFTLTSCPADGTTAMKKNFGGKLRIILGEPSFEALPARIKAEIAPETAHADPVAFYQMMHKTGLTYSGPFQGLTTLQKRTNFASGTVQQLHGEDQTELTVSPATLDSCLQTAFVTVSSPGDKALWTSFLPDTIDCMRFNVASCEGKSDTDLLNIDAYLTDAKSFSLEAAASFTADIEIFGKEDRLQIQVQGLTVASFSTTKPEDDYELYLTTVWDVDPDVKIVTAKQPSKEIEDEPANPVLLESCERVATFYANKRSAKHVKLPPRFALNKAALPVNGWPEETQETIDAFTSASPFFSTLDFVRGIGNRMPSNVYGMLPDIVTEAQHLLRVQHHVSRIVKQIAHKYPRMNVLGWTDEDFALTAHVLNGLDDAFLSYRVGGHEEKKMQERLLTTPARQKKVVIKEFDPNQPRAATDNLYDLVVVTSTMMDELEVLGKVRAIMRPGGFLIWVDNSVHMLSERLDGDESESDEGPNDFRGELGKYGFVYNMKESYQTFRPSYSVLVCQAKSKEKERYRFPFKHIVANQKLVDRLLVIGGKQAWTGAIKNGIIEQLGPHCNGNVMVADSLDKVNIEGLANFPVVILLSDIDADGATGILSSMTAERMEVMRALLSPERRIIWVTLKARFMLPENAAALGFVRTVLAETPSLRIQVLDLTSMEAKPALEQIRDTFARLVSTSPDEGKTANEKPLFINETEVYIEEDGRPIVARCLPWKDGNKRNNAPRRIVTDMHNSLEKALQISYVEKENGSTGYHIEVGDPNSLSLENPRPETIRVDYSTADALSLGDKTAYVWLGRDLVDDHFHVGLSNSNASYLVTAPAVSTSEQSLAQVNQALFVGLVARYLAALALADKLEDRLLVLVEPDEMFLHCARDVLVRRNIFYLVFSTDALRCDGNPNLTFVHAKASTREIKALYPPGTKVQIVDMLPKGSEISHVLKSNLAKGSKYDTESCLLAQEDEKIDASGYPGAVWSEALGLAMTRVKQYMDQSTTENPAKADLITVPALTQTQGQLSPFRVVDWRAERPVAKMLRYFPKPVLSANKTYIMVGITRDFGQSLCHLFATHGARHIVLCSRSPPAAGTKWQRALKARGVTIEFQALDVTNESQVIKFQQNLVNERRLIIGGVINGAMVLEDKVFSEMSVETLRRVMRPKTVGSYNLHMAFQDRENLEFFIMTSSFAAIGGHAGQSNYAAANMYMNGLAAMRRVSGLPGSALNIGVIYGIGFLHREKSDLYKGLEREGYPPISERDIHHMFIEAIEAGKPGNDGIYDVVTGLARYDANEPKLDWQHDPRFSHYTTPEEAKASDKKEGEKEPSIKELLDAEEDAEMVFDILLQKFLDFLAGLLGLDSNHVNADSNISSLGVDSLTAVEIRRWFYKGLSHDVAVMKILDAPSIKTLCRDTATGILEKRLKENEENGSVPPPDNPTGAS